MQWFSSNRINWQTAPFMLGTFLTAITVVPVYLWQVGFDPFQWALFAFMFAACGLSITLGYHRLFSHKTFETVTPVRILTLIFGAAAFENSVLSWASDHRRHHKHVDHEEDPYDITKGFFHAHIGWIVFRQKLETQYDNVNDLKKDPWVMWQHRHCHAIAFVVGFVFPALIGWMYNGAAGALGAFLIGGVLRVVAVQHFTFFINSFCHMFGKRPYSDKSTARDSAIMALFTFGEGYHNFHHTFPQDFRNGVKVWQFDPTKWTILLLNKLGLATKLRRLPDEKIRLAEISEKQRLLRLKIGKTTACGGTYFLLTLSSGHAKGGRIF